MAKFILKLGLGVCFALVLSNTASAATVRLAWDPSATTGVDGYYVKYGTKPGSYTTTINVGNVASYAVSGLAEGTRYYFAVQAFDGSLVSSLTNEVTWVPPITATAPLKRGLDFNGDNLADIFALNPT